MSRVVQKLLPALVVLVLGISPFLSTLFFPSALLAPTGFHDSQRIWLSALLLCVLFCACSKCIRSRIELPAIDPSVVMVLITFFLLGLLSSLFAHSLKHALYEWSNFFLLFLLVMLLAEIIQKNTKYLFNKILFGCGLGCALYAFNAVVVYLSVIVSNFSIEPYEFIHGYDNPRFFNHVQTVALPLITLLVLRSESSHFQRHFWWLVLSIWWALLFLSSGRGTFMGTMVGTCLALFTQRRDALNYCRTALIGGAAGFLMYLFFFVYLPPTLGLRSSVEVFNVIERTVESPDSQRIKLWVLALRLILESPWLGVGPIHFAHFGKELGIAAHPHNWILQIASEWGVPALLSLVGVITVSLKGMLNVRSLIATGDHQQHTILTALIAALAAALIDGLVSGNIVMPTSQLWMSLLLAISWGWARSVHPQSTLIELKLSNSVKACVLICFLFIGVFFLAGMWPEIVQLEKQEELVLESGRQFLSPRLWRAGFLEK